MFLQLCSHKPDVIMTLVQILQFNLISNMTSESVHGLYMYYILYISVDEGSIVSNHSVKP